MFSFFSERNIKEEPEVAEIKRQQLSGPGKLQTNVGVSNIQNYTSVKPHLLTDIRNGHQNKQSQPIQSNKIILGSKPNADRQDDNRNLTLNSEPDEVTQVDNKKLILGSKPNAVKHGDDRKIILCSKPSQDDNKKLILGSKPSSVTQNDTGKLDNKTDYKEKVKYKHLKLVLKDIKSYLHQNGRYCKPCCRLFLSKNALDDHKNKIHKMTKIKNPYQKIKVTRYKCNICGSYFANSGNLCRHHRNIHRKGIESEEKGAKTTFVKAESQKSNRTDEKHKITKPRNEKKLITTKRKIQLSNKCNICNISFQAYHSLRRHYSRYHNTKIILNANNTKLKDLVLGTYSKDKQEIVFTIENDVVASVKDKENNSVANANKNHEVTSDSAQKNHRVLNAKEKSKIASEKNIEVATVKKNLKTASARDKRKFVSTTQIQKNIPTREKSIQKIQSAVKNQRLATGNEKLKANKKNQVAKKKQTAASAKESLQATDKGQVSFIEEDLRTKYVTRAKNSTSQDTNLCLHCNKVFPDQKSLIDHMYDILEPKRNSSGANKIAVSDMKKKEDDKLLFVCRQCSYYLPSTKAYFAHMVRNHKTVIFLEVNTEVFDAQCKYCPYKGSSITAHNKHVHSYHIDLMFLRIENEIENDKKLQRKSCDSFYMNICSEKSFALESVLFECDKCNICFLSSNVARDHKQHMEWINWECSICHRILKDKDKEMHLKQHSFSEPLKVINLNETPVCNVLYNCTKCAIHFTEKRYQEHFPNCGSLATDSTYCKICDILVDKMERINHKTQHKHLRDITDFTIINSNIIVDTAISLKRKGTDTESEVRPRKRLYEQHNCLTYCHTCKSFLSDSGLKNKSHISRTCSHIVKYACNECGLVFTNSVLKLHKERHGKEKNLRLQDYKFFDLQGKQVLPPIPEYPHCKICGVHFLRKNAISGHICDETYFLTCDICNIKLTETAFKIHMSFHLYVIQKTSIQNETWNTRDQSSNSDVSNLPHQTPVTSKTTTKPVAKTQLKSELTKTTTNPEEKVHYKSELSKLVDQPAEIIPNSNDQNRKTEVKKKHSTDLIEEQIPNDDSLVVLYTCKTCGVTVESYDEVIKHCQTHYSDMENQITSVKKCKQCSLKYEFHSFKDHQQRVHSGVSKIQVLKFDPSYFTSKNMIWVKHIYQTLPEDAVKELLKKSIYQHEHRIQLECIQKGSSHLYVYKCDTCGNFIDPGCVYKHAENPCGKVRKHPCSLCGLPFISAFSRTSHEKLHRQINGLTKKSLNIILFNQSKDKAFNNRIFCTTNQYILYQCRNCAGVAEKSMLTNHMCDRNTLIKCITCGLLISKEEFKAHFSKHTDLGNYYAENFKVILFGSKISVKSNVDVLKTLSPSFSGTVYDYSLYKCKICEICLKNNENTEKHICLQNFDLDRSMCPECDLYFPSGNLKHHVKQHRTDPEFIKENINVITFNDGYLSQANDAYSFTKNENKETTEVKTKINEKDEFTTEKTINVIIDECKEKSDDNSNAKSNNSEKSIDGVKEKSVNNSNKISIDYGNSDDGNENNGDNDVKEQSLDDIQRISIFKVTTDITNDSIVKNYNEKSVDDGNTKTVIDSKEKRVDEDDKSVDDGMGNSDDKDPGKLYKCACGLHFLNKLKVYEHLKKCQPKAKQYKQNCSKCNLLFNPSELFTHLVVHHRYKTQTHNFNIIDISIDDVTN